MDLDVLKRVHGFGRLKHEADGKVSLRFTAIDPATKFLTCSCGKSDCQIQLLRGLREHISSLFRATASCGYEEVFADFDRAEDPWPGVIYALQMAASIEDVFADPSYVDDSEAAFWCEPVWENDERDREAASKYAAALIIFNFVWAAYEAAIETSAGSLYPKDKVPVRGRKILQSEQAIVDSMPSFAYIYRLARFCCLKAPLLQKDISKSENDYGLVGAASAAELGRVFRNYLVHGNDSFHPHYVNTWTFYRFYAVSKMLLVLIQILVLRRIDNIDARVRLSQNADEGDEGYERVQWIFCNLHLREPLWIGKDPKQVQDPT
jgi:hypothetical protein